MQKKYFYLFLVVLFFVALGVPAVLMAQAVLTTSPLAPVSARQNLSAPSLITSGRQAPASSIETTILLYHYIEELSPADSKNPLRRDFITTPNSFALQLKYLKDNNYKSIDLYRLHDAMTKGGSLPHRSISITFDDGDISVYTKAFPLMKKYGFTGTIFMITQFADENRPGYITWAQALEMAQAGWRLEAHTKTHPSLRGNSHQYQNDQIGGSVEAIQKHTGYRPRFFAYPYGEYDATSIAVAKEVGLWGALTTKPGDNIGLLSAYELPRMEVFRSTTQQAFILSLKDHKQHVL